MNITQDKGILLSSRSCTHIEKENAFFVFFIVPFMVLNIPLRWNLGTGLQYLLPMPTC